MIKVFIVDGVAVMAAEAELVQLLEDSALIGATEFDELGQPLNGERYLCFNASTETLDVEALPAPWVPHAYLRVGDELVLDEDSTAWREHLAARAEEFAALVRQYDGHVQQRLDAHAAAMGYGDPNRPEVSPILHAITYADEAAVPKFQAEGRALRAWRSLYWAACWPVLEAVRNSGRAVPTPAELLAELDAAAPPPTAEDVAIELQVLVS